MGSLMQLLRWLISCCKKWMDEPRSWLSERIAAFSSEADYCGICTETGEERHYGRWRFYEVLGASCASYYP